MNKQLDNLFKNKLQDHVIEPTPNSWARVASGLTKKNNYAVWYSAAAAIVLIGFGATFWIYSGNETQPIDSIVQRDNSENGINGLNNSNDAVSKNNEATPLIIEPQKKNMVAASKPKSTIKESIGRGNEVAMKTEVPVIELASTPIAHIEEQELIPNESITIASKPIVIVIELKPINKREQTPFELEQPQRKTGLQKVLEVANDMRTGDNPLGGLRQAKEEILAFNFRKEDRKTND